MESSCSLVCALLIGDSGVGKSSLVARLCGETPSHNMKSTIGAEFKNIILDPGDASQKRVKMQIWDTAGQERYHSITVAQFRMKSVVIMLYDITRRDTFENITKWVEEMKRFSDPSIPHVCSGCQQMRCNSMPASDVRGRTPPRREVGNALRRTFAYVRAACASSHPNYPSENVALSRP